MPGVGQAYRVTETTTGFYVYEDMPTRKATVHRGDCPFCNHGQGRQPTRNEGENWWSGRFDTAEAARSAPIPANATLRDCRRCMV
jgi:F-type H+/Na+-transporting ATPase subunit beta